MSSEHDLTKWNDSQGFAPGWFDDISNHWDEYEKLAALNYTPADIAMYFDAPVAEFEFYFSLIGSPLKYHYERGPLLQKAQEGMSMIRDASTGENVVQAQRLDAARRNKDYKNALDEIIFYED